jgi:pimeloyl-ACP methyl ester carboxylesterase
LQRPERKEHYVRVQEWRLRFLEAGTGPAVVLVHGLGGSAESWLTTLDALADRLHLYAVDLVGFGHSDKPNLAYRVEDFVACVRDFAEALGVPSFALVGFSMGGQIAATFAASYPSRVRQLVLVASAGISTEYTPALRQYTHYAASWAGTRKRLEALVVNPQVITEELVNYAHTVAQLPGAERAFRKALSASGRAPRLTSLLGRITCPTLILWGQDDPVIPVQYAHVFRTGIANSRIHIFERCGHVPYREQPAEFLAALRAFLLE